MNLPHSSGSQSIFQTIEKLRHLTQIDIQTQWRYSSEDLPISALNISNCQPVQLNKKGYIVWPAGHQVRWLVQKIIIPQQLQGYPLAGLSLRLKLTWWAEDAQIFLNNILVQQGDLFDSSARVLLTPSATPGAEITVALRLVSPGHDIGALMRSECVYERQEDNKNQSSIDPGFVANELTVLNKYWSAFEPEKLAYLATAITEINWKALAIAEVFEVSLQRVRTKLQPLAISIKERSFHLLGHAHLDMAWLWPVSETWDAAQRTFTSVLSLQKEFSELTFCHTSPALYAWIEEHLPDLFAAIQKAVKEGSWEVLGGMWIEPEVNLISGESLVRQLLYGQKYTQEKFGHTTKIAWLPDSFGFCWQLPQILQKSGIEYFVTGKLHWNDTTKFPHGVFWWESPDGTRILTLMSPPNKEGVMDTNPLTMTDYGVEWEQQTGFKDAFWIPGVGDHGGGPTRDMLEVQRRWQKSPFFPRIRFTTALEYLQQINPQTSTKTNSEFSLPIWRDELYLEFHRGCYTTHGDQKAFNRRCEHLLYQAELWASLATICQALPYAYPKKELEEAWKKVLFNQFHDILPGTSINQVFVEANQAWQKAEQTATQILEDAFNAIASQISLPPPPQPEAKPFFVFNSLNWKRSEVVAVSLPTSGNWEVYNLDGQKLPSQVTEKCLYFLSQDIPSVGYHLFWLCPNLDKVSKPKSKTNFILENEKLKVIVDSETGDLSSIFDKSQQREILNGKGNQLQAFRDEGQYWDAWNIDPNYSQHPLPSTQLISIQWLDCGPIQQRIRVIRKLGNSEFRQDYLLEANSPLLKIVTKVDWQETHVMVKAAFPLQLDCNFATYEMPCGAIERPTQPQTEAEKAKWEVPALHWADLTDDEQEYGVSILNDCKYGYDSKPNCLRLTLLRSSRWPDAEADRGIHQFTYAVYPHQESWQAAETVHYGYELNVPLKVVFGQIYEEKAVSLNSKLSPAGGQLLHLLGQNLILIAFKPPENGTEGWILRCYECHGEATDLCLESDLELAVTESLDLLERSTEEDEQINPWKIASFRVI